MGHHLAIRVGTGPLEGGREVGLDHRYRARREAAQRPPVGDERACSPHGSGQHERESQRGEDLAGAGARRHQHDRLRDRRVSKGDQERDPIDGRERGDLDERRVGMLGIAEQSPRLLTDATAEELRGDP